MWNVLLRFLLEGFFELSIIVLIDYQNNYWDIANAHEKISHILCFTIGFLIVTFPFVIFYIL